MIHQTYHATSEEIGVMGKLQRGSTDRRSHADNHSNGRSPIDRRGIAATYLDDKDVRRTPTVG